MTAKATFKFFTKLLKHLINKTKDRLDEIKVGDGVCMEWIGCKDKNGYGVKRITWPDGTRKLDKAHRLAFMAHYKVMYYQMPKTCKIDEFEVSHLCHNKGCINPLHLTLELRSTNNDRNYCKKSGACNKRHWPHCLFVNSAEN